ncbi:LysR family transcriptional regulator [Aestuariispira insulae]|uniref:LysR family transcriptional regulator n=1 Tax=Aestuariispira insulae TaxID=1461337 RepID=A0A3D9H6F9_9PROT|nr:LysR family transcriptional regulator [Aestuariispira insulae]RED45080.1 LysR family transcriptional regulator [Aestuariispira insulae]
MDWNHIKIFAAVANQGSLSGAARLLGMSQPTVGRHIEALEKALNVRLFDREAKGYVLTCAGERLLPQVSAMERAAITIDDIATGTADRLEGVVRITSPEMASRFFGRRLVGLRQQLPDIQIEFLTSNKVLNLSRREADIAIRPVMPDHGDLRIKQAYMGQLAVYGCSDYIKAHPQALTEERYQACDWVTMKHGFVLNQLDRWLMETKRIRHNPIQCTSVHTLVEAVLGGAGLAMLFTKHADEIPGLMQASPVIREMDQQFWLVAHAEVLAQPRVRAVWDWLDTMLSEEFEDS